MISTGPDTGIPLLFWFRRSLTLGGISGDGASARPLRFLGSAVIAIALWAFAGSWPVHANELKGHPSPYLALHGEDPVAWRDWRPGLLAEAQRSGRPVFISSGYFACHWCHVMQRESYRNSTIADLLNRHFIPVKLDRELDPALDDHLIRFVERSEGVAGWPLNVFLTPDGYPIVGMTYVPPERFELILSRIAESWQQKRGQIEALARSASKALEGERPTQVLPFQAWPSADSIVAGLVSDALKLADELGGGFGTQNKFPMEPQLFALLEVLERNPNDALGAFLQNTLDQMARRGLRDHLAGGFFRYTVDPDWRTPHFEKMLYNQAQLARVYLKGAKVFGRPDLAEVARDTLDFVLRDMTGVQGGFVAGLSAVDNDGEEGAAYLWGEPSLKRLLDPEELRVVVIYWSLNPEASPDAGLLPQRLRTETEVASVAGIEPDRVAKLVASARAKLMADRALREAPRDTKQLAAWNGLVLSALVEAADALGESRYAEAAADLATFLGGLWDGERLLRARHGLRILGEASLEDYACVAEGLAAWAHRTGDPEDLALAKAVTERGWREFFSAGDGGWRLASSEALPGMAREPAMQDGALAAPSAVLMRVTRALWPASDAQDGALGLSAGAVAQAPFWFASHALELIDATQGRRR